jgi:hypothetical protein
MPPIRASARGLVCCPDWFQEPVWEAVWDCFPDTFQEGVWEAVWDCFPDWFLG